MDLISFRVATQWLWTLVIFATFGSVAYGADTYNPQTLQLSIPSMSVGNASYVMELPLAGKPPPPRPLP